MNKPNRTRLRLITASALAAASFAGVARAASTVWSGPATGGDFNTVTNWTNGLPDSDDTAVFNSTKNVNGTVSFASTTTNLDLHLRNNPGAINFAVGSGNTYTVTRNFIIGAAANETNTTTFSSGTTNANLLLIGNNAAATGNSLTVTGPGTVFNSTGTGSAFRVGSNGGSNTSLTVSDGGLMTSTNLAIIGLQSSSNNTITVTGEGSQLTVGHSLSMGDNIAEGLPEQTNQQFKILDKGFASIRELIVGTTAASPNNTVTVSGIGSKLNIRGGQQFPPTEIGQRMDIGRASVNNKLIINNGGEVYGGGIYHLGRETTSTGNLLSVTDGKLTGSGVELKRGKLFIQNSDVDIFRKFDAIIGNPLGGSILAQFPTAEIEFKSGTLGTVNAVIDNDSPFVIGDGGALPATYILKTDPTATTSQTHSFADGMFIASNGRVQGSTNITGNVVNAGLISVGNTSGALRITGTLTFTAGGQADVGNGRLIVTGTAVGTWNGSNYDGLTGAIASGRNGGAWNGETGIITSQTNATTSDYTSIGVASASEVTGIANDGIATTTWSGKTVTGADTLVMYTYGGDANLSGNVDIDDYGLIDFNASVGGVLTGWYNGDFDYSGSVDIDDYGIIDFVVNIQGAPFVTSADAGFAITSVPEPVLSSLAILAIPLTRRRRR